MKFGAVEKEFGKGVLTTRQLNLTKTNENLRTIDLTADERIAGTNLIQRAGMDREIKGSTWKTLEEL